jgi:predicted permease
LPNTSYVVVFTLTVNLLTIIVILTLNIKHQPTPIYPVDRPERHRFTTFFSDSASRSLI